MDYEFIDLVKIFQENSKNNFANWTWADVFKLKNKLIWSISNDDQKHYFKYFLLKKLNKLLLEKK